MERNFFIFLFICATTLTNAQNAYDAVYEENEEWPMCELGGSYTLPHSTYCDRFFTCQQGQTFMGQCDDGFGYSPFKGCMLLHLVDCTTRPKLQKPKGSENCPRLNGLFIDPRGCGRFYKCENGTAVPDACAPSLMLDDVEKVCRNPTEAEIKECTPSSILPVLPPAGPSVTSSSSATSTSSASVSVLTGGIGSLKPQEVALFRCPEPGLFPYGDHARYPYPGNCRFYVMCLRDGGLKVGGCPDGSGYNHLTANCDLDLRVHSCT